jgi:uncharacterized membrane protein
MNEESSTGLSSRTAATLAYGGWWITGLIVWMLERRDRYARFHAAQAVVAFGAIALLTLALGMLALASLSFMPAMFTALAGAAIVTWLVGVALWVVSLWKAASGAAWHIPIASRFAVRLNGEAGTGEGIGDRGSGMRDRG